MGPCTRARGHQVRNRLDRSGLGAMGVAAGERNFRLKTEL